MPAVERARRAAAEPGRSPVRAAPGSRRPFCGGAALGATGTAVDGPGDAHPLFDTGALVAVAAHATQPRRTGAGHRELCPYLQLATGGAHSTHSVAGGRVTGE